MLIGELQSITPEFIAHHHDRGLIMSKMSARMGMLPLPRVNTGLYPHPFSEAPEAVCLLGMSNGIKARFLRSKAHLVIHEHPLTKTGTVGGFPGSRSLGLLRSFQHLTQGGFIIFAERCLKNPSFSCELL
jgi:hypothetical protein